MNGNRGRATSRGVGWVAAIAVTVVTLVAAVPSAEGSGTVAFRGASWNPVLDKSVGGCALGTAAQPHWNKTTGDGHWRASGDARTCPRAQGGRATASYADSEGDLSIQVPVNLPSGRGGLNLSWSIDIAAATAGRIAGSPYCPTRTTVNDVDYGFSWYNTTYVQAFCSAMAEVYMIGSAFVIDQTTGVDYYPSNYWSEPFNLSGVVTENYTTYETWSNASYWSNNATYHGNVTYAFGPSGNLTGVYQPQWFINGTFSSSDRYVVSTDIELICNADVSGYASGRASASVNAERTPHHWNLLPFHIW